MRPTETTHRFVRCPACGGESVYSLTNPFRPFCCERCKQLDLGAWAKESFRVGETSREVGSERPPTDQHG